MDEKQKGRLVYVCGWVAFGLVCAALTAAKCVAPILPVRAFHVVLAVFVLWNAYLSGIEFASRKPLWKRALMTLGSGLAAYALIWVFLNFVVPAPA